MREAIRPERAWWFALATLGVAALAGLGDPDRPIPRNEPPKSPPAPPPTAPKDGPRLFTTLEFARMGDDAAREFLGPLDGGKALAAVENAGAAVARIRITLERGPQGRVEYSSNGVLVNGGRHLLVAGESLRALEAVPVAQIQVVQSDGRRRKVRLPVLRGGEDGAPAGKWGIVELDRPGPEGSPSLPIHSLSRDATVVALCFPGGIGAYSGGGIDWDEGLPLRPLAIVGKVVDAADGRVRLTAGSRPLANVEGAAVVDLAGNLVAIALEVGMSRSTGTEQSWKAHEDPKTKPIVRFREEQLWLESTPADVFREFLAERWKR